MEIKEYKYKTICEMPGCNRLAEISFTRGAGYDNINICKHCLQEIIDKVDESYIKRRKGFNKIAFDYVNERHSKYSNFSQTALREIARKKGVERYYEKDKDQLVEILEHMED